MAKHRASGAPQETEEAPSGRRRQPGKWVLATWLPDHAQIATVPIVVL